MLHAAIGDGRPAVVRRARMTLRQPFTVNAVRTTYFPIKGRCEIIPTGTEMSVADSHNRMPLFQ